MSGLLVTLPLHLVCQLINPENSGYGNVTIVEDTSVQIHTAILPGGYTAFPDVGLAYKFYQNRLTWNEARKLCIAEGGSLAIVDSFQKITHIMTINKGQGVHTGIHRLYDSVEWSDIKSGQPLRFIPWKPDANLGAGTGQCVAMWFDGSGVGPWNCNSVLPVVCEIPMFKSTRSELLSFEKISSIIPAN